MQNEFRGQSIKEVVRKAVSGDLNEQIESKGYEVAQVWAPPLSWGPWLEVFAQWGVVGPDRDDHVTQVQIGFDTNTRAPSTFDVEIRGGDSFVRSIGPGSENVTISGNVATAVSIRCRSHSFGQNIFITSSW